MLTLIGLLINGMGKDLMVMYIFLKGNEGQWLNVS